MLTVVQAVAIIERAFAPCRCVVQLDSWQQKLKFAVFAPDDKMIKELKDVNVTDAREEHMLKVYIDRMREEVEKRFTLDPWPGIDK